MFLILALWILLSLPIGVVVGRAIAWANRR